MKKINCTFLFFISPFLLLAQTSQEIIQKVEHQQNKINNLSYHLERTDTIGKVIRSMSGQAIFEKNSIDTVFGFKFWAEKNGDSINKFFDGKVGYEIDKLQKNYETTVSRSGFKNLLMGGGGHMVVPDLIKLDTTNAIKINLTEDAKHYILKIIYADLEQYDVNNRFKEIYIDKVSFLPASVREHQESYDRIQDLYYEISQLKINDAANQYNFLEPKFISEYKHSIPQHKEHPIYQLIGKSMPKFKLKDFNGKEVNSDNSKNKVVLLDFWEVWCGPCIESMPKVEELQKKYASKGLLTYGIVNDLENIEASKKMVKKRGYSLPMLIGNEQIKKDFKIHTVPLYMVIDKKGVVIFISEGYYGKIEETIINALKE